MRELNDEELEFLLNGPDTDGLAIDQFVLKELSNPDESRLRRFLADIERWKKAINDRQREFLEIYPKLKEENPDEAETRYGLLFHQVNNAAVPIWSAVEAIYQVLRDRKTE